MTIRKATIEDLNQLITLRLDYLRMDHGELTAEQEAGIRQQLSTYLPRHFAAGDFIAMMAEENGRIVSSAFLVVVEKPANPSFPTGRTGTIQNVLTYPEHRRQGYAFKVLTALIEQAKNIGVSQLDLMATDVGRPLYEKLGFTVPHYTSMRLRLD